MAWGGSYEVLGGGSGLRCDARCPREGSGGRLPLVVTAAIRAPWQRGFPYGAVALWGGRKWVEKKKNKKIKIGW